MLPFPLIASSALKEVYACMNKADKVILEKIVDEINTSPTELLTMIIEQCL